MQRASSLLIKPRRSKSTFWFLVYNYLNTSVPDIHTYRSAAGQRLRRRCGNILQHQPHLGRAKRSGPMILVEHARIQEARNRAYVASLLAARQLRDVLSCATG